MKHRILAIMLSVVILLSLSAVCQSTEVSVFLRNQKVMVFDNKTRVFDSHFSIITDNKTWTWEDITKTFRSIELLDKTRKNYKNGPLRITLKNKQTMDVTGTIGRYFGKAAAAPPALRFHEMTAAGKQPVQTIAIQKVAKIVFGKVQLKHNPKTGTYYPAELDKDPADGTTLKQVK